MAKAVSYKFLLAQWKIGMHEVDRMASTRQQEGHSKGRHPFPGSKIRRTPWCISMRACLNRLLEGGRRRGVGGRCGTDGGGQVMEGRWRRVEEGGGDGKELGEEGSWEVQERSEVAAVLAVGRELNAPPTNRGSRLTLWVWAHNSPH